MKQFITSMVIVCFALSSLGQQANHIKGKVYDAYNGNPLSDVNIRINGGGGTVTDNKGEFSLSCSGVCEIMVTHLCYESVKFTVKEDNKSFKIGLIPTSYNLNEVSIKSSHIESNKNLTKAQSIAVITPEKVEREEGLSFDKVINLEPGIFSQVSSIPGTFGDGVSGLNASVTIRGYIGYRNAGGYKTYLNGIPLTDAEGQAGHENVDYSIIGKTEIIKGPSSSLYGSGIGGVIKLNTIQPKPLSTRIVQQTLLGSYGLYRTNTRLESGTNNSSIILNYGHQYYHGWIKNTNSRKDYFTFAGTFRPTEKQTFFIYSSYTNKAGSISIESLDSVDYFNQVVPVNEDEFESIKDKEVTESYRVGMSHNYQFTEHFSNLTSAFTSGVMEGDQNIGGRTEFNLVFGNDKVQVKGTVGDEIQKSKSYQTKYNKLDDGSEGALNTYNDYYAFQNNLFTEWELQLPYDFIFTAGASYNLMEFEIVDHLGYADNPSDKLSVSGFKKFDPILTPRVALLKSFNDNFSVYVNASEGYQPYGMSKTITIAYLGEVNDELMPERGTQFEIGSKGSFLDKKLSYQLALFHLDISDKITTQSVYKDNGSILYSWYTNSGHQIDRGIELSATYALINNKHSLISSLQPFVSFTYSDFYYQDFKSDNNNDKNTIDYTGNKVIGVPPVLFNAGIDLDLKFGLYLTTTYRYVDESPGDYANVHWAEAYSLLGAKIGYKRSLGDHFMFNASVGGNNLTGSTYYVGGGSSKNPLGSVYVPAPYTATFYGRINLSYTF